jgi:catalase
MLTEAVSKFPYEEPTMFVLDAYRHGKPTAASGGGVEFLKSSKVPSKAFGSDYGVNRCKMSLIKE